MEKLTISKMETTQTAIDWLVKELELEGYDHTIRIAKNIEKEQIKFAYSDGAVDVIERKYKGMQKYYNEKYTK